MDLICRIIHDLLISSALILMLSKTVSFPFAERNLNQFYNWKVLRQLARCHWVLYLVERLRLKMVSKIKIHPFNKRLINFIVHFRNIALQHYKDFHQITKSLRLLKQKAWTQSMNVCHRVRIHLCNANHQSVLVVCRPAVRIRRRDVPMEHAIRMKRMLIKLVLA